MAPRCTRYIVAPREYLPPKKIGGAPICATRARALIGLIDAVAMGESLQGLFKYNLSKGLHKNQLLECGQFSIPLKLDVHVLHTI